MDWFAKNGDRLLNSATLIAGVLGASKEIPGSIAIKCMLATTILTGLHQIWYPNSPTVTVPGAKP